MMQKFGWIVNMAALLEGWLVGSVPKIDLAWAVNKKGRLKVLDFE